MAPGWANASKAADELAALGLSTTVADARFAKPLDIDLLLRLAREHEVLMTIEEGAIGGFGSYVLQTLADHGVLDSGLKVRSMVLPDVFLDQDTPAAMYAKAGLDAEGIVAKVFEALGRDAMPKPLKLGLAMTHRDLPETPMTQKTPLRVILAQPRGFCAGVVRAIEIVERSLEKYDAPVYVRHEIVHNKHVVDGLKAKGARFVEELSEIPDNAVTIFSAHGVARRRWSRRRRRGTCRPQRHLPAGHQGS